jgi:hypothetical protein
MACYNNGYAAHSYEASLPPVSTLLMHEAEAWRALLQLHTGVVGTARKLAAATSETETGTVLESTREAIEAREAAYYAGLSQLASQCDAMATEALRLRSLRKSRASADVLALQVLMQSHSAETLATGSTLSSNSGLEVSAVATELRQAAQATRQQIAQVRAVMQLVQDAPSLVGRVQLAYRDCLLNTDEVFEAVYRHSEQLTDEALLRALEDLAAPSGAQGASSPAPAERARTIVRRHADGKRGGSGR